LPHLYNAPNAHYDLTRGFGERRQGVHLAGGRRHSNSGMKPEPRQPPVVLGPGAEPYRPPPPPASASDHVRTAGHALVNWWRAVSIEALLVAILWFGGLEILRVPLAPAWALVAGLMAFVPNFGGVLALLGPTFAILLTGQDLVRLAYLLGLYAGIVVIDQLLIQPLVLKRVTRVPIWPSILVPIVLGFVIPFWGVLLAPPLLAVVYAFRKPRRPA
jgi:predicted PurR-regulated permease PerM